jgi:hypothetical protein
MLRGARRDQGGRIENSGDCWPQRPHMIAKGTTHNNGAKLAQYMTTGKEGERAELWQICGFAAGDIREAFRSVHVMAEATRCEQPFFHVQVRNPDGEELSRDQWRQVANRIEAKLGLTDQPRAIAFHLDEATGHEHMHIAWSRIDGETMTARPLPFFKERLKEVSRELEKILDLTRVASERSSSVLAPTRDEFEQARRLGVDIQTARQTIRDCFERSDNGHSFGTALADHGFVLAQGDRRAFVVIDHEGGLHALGKRILGISANQTRDRLADLERDELPMVEQARTFVRARQDSREKIEAERMGDPHREEMAWQDALDKAAIEKERLERAFVEPGRGMGTDATVELERQAFQDLSSVGTLKRKGDHPPPQHLNSIEKQIWTDYHDSVNARTFVAALAEHRIELAIVTKEEADRSHREAEFAKAVGNYATRYREGEILAITEAGPIFRREGEPVEARRVYRLNERTTGQNCNKVERFLDPVRSQLKGVDATKEMLNVRAGDRAAYWDRIRLDNAQQTNRFAPKKGKTARAPAALGQAAERRLGKALDTVGNVIESFLAPVLTPEQKREGARTTRERAEEAADTIDLSRYLSDREVSRQSHENESEAARQRQRDDGRER